MGVMEQFRIENEIEPRPSFFSTVPLSTDPRDTGTIAPRTNTVLMKLVHVGQAW